MQSCTENIPYQVEDFLFNISIIILSSQYVRYARENKVINYESSFNTKDSRI